MDQLKYSIRQEGGLWHWSVFVSRGVQIGHGAATDNIRSRAEALAFATDPARAEDIDRVEQEHFKLAHARALQAFVDAWSRAMHATAWLEGLRQRHAASMTLVERSQKEITRARQLLDANSSPG